MKISSLRYYFKQALISMSKNGLMTFASIITISSCIFILITSFNIAANLDYMLGNFENSIGLKAYINDTVSNDEVAILYNEIMELPHVVSVRFISQEEAFADFEQSLDDKSYILIGLPQDTLLPRSFEIMLDDNNYVEDVVLVLKHDTGETKSYSSIRHAQEETQALISINNTIRIVSLILIIILAFISTVIITNTIKIAVNYRRTEINIMKYIGATNWFIRWPFIIEGLLIGLIGSIIPIVITYLTYNKTLSSINDQLTFVDGLFTYKPIQDLMVFSIPLSIGLGILIGVIGSVTSIRKHLNV